MVTETQQNLEREALNAAYQQQLGLLFNVYCLACGADGAEDRFRAGLQQARACYADAVDALALRAAED